MDAPVLKPGGFWICPACGQRNKVWAPCSRCGTALADMPADTAELPGALPENARAAGERRRGRGVYLLVAAGVLAAAGIALALSRMLGGAALGSPKAAATARPRAALAPPTPAPVPQTLPESTPIPLPPPPVQDSVPATPPAAVYAPSRPSPSAWSIPAAPRPIEPERSPYADARPDRDLRAREQAVRAAQARFRRAEAALPPAGEEGADADSAAAELEQAARDLREAEAALDRARRRRPR